MRILSKLTIAGLVVGAIASAVVVHQHRAHPSELAGLWTLWPDSKSDGDPVRFYFFHEDGIGLYRYGKIGLNTTNSFDWKVDDGQLVMTFRKTGEVVKTPFNVTARELTLTHDPKEPLTANVRYTFVPAPAQATEAPDLFDGDASGKPGEIAGRLWMDRVKFATGGEQFSLYQLKDAAIDGRGVGWWHLGDFDDWSTEALTFRNLGATSEGGAMEFDFTVRDEHAKSALRHDKKSATLTFVEDPRAFWHVHAYKDAGPSFGSFMAARH